MNQTPTTPAVKGILISLVLIIMGLITHFAGLDLNKTMGAIQYIIFGGGLIWACISYSKQSNGNVTFGNTFAHGFKTTAAITGIFALYTYISLKFIMPETIDLALEVAKKGMAEKNMPASQIEQGISMTRKFFIPFAIGGVIVMYLIMGLFFSAVGALIAKKNPNPNPLEQ
jgi:hypothetical protein